jgi:import inner membrane translocase subunit TIM21
MSMSVQETARKRTNLGRGRPNEAAPPFRHAKAKAFVPLMVQSDSRARKKSSNPNNTMQSLRVLPRLPTSRIGLRSVQACTQLRTATSSSTTSAPGPARRSVTITNDTGRVPWSELSWRERGARTTQQSANLGVVILGIVMTGGVATVLWLEVFSGDSKTAVYNRAFERIRNDPKCIDVLAGRGKGGEIEAWGENRVRNSRFARDTIS